MNRDPATAEFAGQPASPADQDAALACEPEPPTPIAGGRASATYPSGRTVEGIWSPTGNGLDGFGLHTDDGHLHIYATRTVHCQVVNGPYTDPGPTRAPEADPSRNAPTPVPALSVAMPLPNGPVDP